MYSSSNCIVRTCFNHAYYNANSCTGAKLAFIRNAYGVDIIQRKLGNAINHIHEPQLTVNEHAAIYNLKTLLSVRSNQSLIAGFDFTDIDEMISFIATH